MNRERIWIMDRADDAAERLERWGRTSQVRVEHLRDAVELLDRLERELPDQLLLAPAADVAETVSLVSTLTQHPAWKRVPVYVLARDRSLALRRELRAAGAWGVLGLPIDAMELETKVLGRRERPSLTVEPSTAASHRAVASAHEVELVRRQLDARVAMAAMTVHDLGNPLATVMLASDLLMSDELAPAQRRRVELLSAAASRMESLLDTLAAFSRLDAGTLEVEPELEDPVAVVRERIALQELVAGTRDVRITAHLPAAPMRVRFDVRLFRRIVDNLLAYALRRAPRGSQVIVRLTAHSAPTVRLTVLDFGGDLPEEVRTLHAADVARGTGTSAAAEAGLGLAFASMAAEAMGGHFSLEREAIGGASYRVDVPMPDAEARRERGAPLARAC